MKNCYPLTAFLFGILYSCFSFSQVNLDSGLVGCYPFSGNANDLSGNKHNGIVNGATLTTDRFGNANSAYLFNGTSASIAINNFDSLSSANELSISLWAQATVSTSNSAFMLSTDAIADRLVGSVEYEGNIYFDYGDISANGRSVISQNYDTNWHHYVFVVSQSKNSKQVFEDGLPVINTSYGSSLVNRNRTLLIGAGTDANGGNIRFNGAIDDIRIFNRSVSGAEVNQLYSSKTAVCSPSNPVDSGLVLCLPLKGNATDFSGFHHNGQINGATLTTDRFGNANSAYLFNGTNAFIAINNFDSLSSTNELSICFWAQADLNTSNSVFMLSTDAIADRLVGSVEYEGNIYFDYGDISANGRSVVSQNYDTNWHHYVFAVSQSKNSKQVFEDGLQVINTTYGSSLVNRNRTLLIGAGTDANGGNIRFNGSIAEFQIFNYALSSSQVTGDYSAFSCGKTTGISNISLQNNAVTVFPNPASGEVSINLGIPTIEPTILKFVNVLGQIMYSEIVPQGSKLIRADLTGKMNSGLYSLILQGNSGDLKAQKVIFNK